MRSRARGSRAASLYAGIMIEIEIPRSVGPCVCGVLEVGFSDRVFISPSSELAGDSSSGTLISSRQWVEAKAGWGLFLHLRYRSWRNEEGQPGFIRATSGVFSMCYELEVTPRAPATAGTRMRPIELQKLADNRQDVALVSAR